MIKVQGKLSAMEEAQEFIYGIPKFSSKNSLEDTRHFLEFLNHPGEKLKIIHIAGTNGKGSVCAFLSSVLQEAKYRVGLFTSPHLEDIRERFQIQRQLIEEEDFLRIYEYLREQIRLYQTGGKPSYHPSFFEFLFLMALFYFDQQEVDFVILETGLGGRLDATNVMEHPILCGITKMGLDHTEYLGETLGEIAAEKAGIIKKQVPICYWRLSDEIATVIEHKAEISNSPVFPVSEEDFRIHQVAKKSIDFSMDSRYYGYIRLTISTGALYQVENAALAVRLVEVLNSIDSIEHKITKEELSMGLLHMHWHGRMEEILPDVFLDGAHNEDGIYAFLETVKARAHLKPSRLLFSVVMEKDYTHMIQAICDSHLFCEIIVTKLESSRGLSLDAMKPIFRSNLNEKITYIGNTEEAFCYAWKQKQEGETLYVAGSLYLVGHIMTLCHKKKLWEDML